MWLVFRGGADRLYRKLRAKLLALTSVLQVHAEKYIGVRNSPTAAKNELDRLPKKLVRQGNSFRRRPRHGSRTEDQAALWDGRDQDWLLISPGPEVRNVRDNEDELRHFYRWLFTPAGSAALVNCPDLAEAERSTLLHRAAEDVSFQYTRALPTPHENFCHVAMAYQNGSEWLHARNSHRSQHRSLLLAVTPPFPDLVGRASLTCGSSASHNPCTASCRQWMLPAAPIHTACCGCRTDPTAKSTPRVAIPPASATAPLGQSGTRQSKWPYVAASARLLTTGPTRLAPRDLLHLLTYSSCPAGPASPADLLNSLCGTP